MATSSRPCTIPALSSPPVLSSRGRSALVRPPLIRCALFECQYSAVNSSGLINLGVAENVSPLARLAPLATLQRIVAAVT